MSELKDERTLVLVKPDGVKRGLIGDLVSRIEQRGLKIIALKMIHPDREFIKGHLPGTEEWIKGMGNKTLDSYKKYGKDPVQEMGTDDPLEIGNHIFEWLIEFLMSGPMVAVVVSGLHAIDMCRKIVGNTIPNKADMGTFRGDYSVDSPTLANEEKRAIRNLCHASGDEKEAAHEVKYWFDKNEICDYKRSDEDIMF